MFSNSSQQERIAWGVLLALAFGVRVWASVERSALSSTLR